VFLVLVLENSRRSHEHFALPIHIHIYVPIYHLHYTLSHLSSITKLAVSSSYDSSRTRVLQNHHHHPCPNPPSPLPSPKLPFQHSCYLNLTSASQRLKSSLHYSIGNIIDSISLDQDLNTTPDFIAALTELVWSQILTSGADLEAFAKHAGRGIVDVKDVLLLVRRNEQLKEVLEEAGKEGGER
jgi:centromere protein S